MSFKFDGSTSLGTELRGAPWTGQARTRFLTAVASLVVLWFPAWAPAQLAPEVVSQFNRSVTLSIDATTVLAGDNAFGGGSFWASTSRADADLNVSKFGGSGDVGDPRPLGLLGIQWQPRLQGSMGYLTYKNDFKAAPLSGDENKYTTYAVDFGGGARFWFDDHLSLAPTISGIYGHTKNEYSAFSSLSRANYAAADQAGLINWDVDTWTIVPATELSYQWTWRRVTFTASSSFNYFHTEDFHSSSSKVSIKSDSETWENKFDVDVPIGATLLSREVHVGGYYSWTGFYGDLREGFSESQLKVNGVNEIHGRVVLDVLNKLRKLKWLGVGGSYFWGDQFTGWSIGVDASFKF
ncbi:MAG TPA: hypothetical protein VL361_15715 [Candidatus Limnocylindrales bacterium]|nr:hypothetical protein [Candidatus Limnocylindrales bacterium]